MAGNAGAALVYGLAGNFNQRKNLFYGRFCRWRAGRGPGPFLFNSLCPGLCKKFHGGGNPHTGRELVSSVTAIICRVRINAFRQQPFHHPIAIRTCFHRKHSLHQEGKTLAVPGFQGSSVIQEKLGNFRHRSLGCVVQHASPIRTDAVGRSAFFHEQADARFTSTCYRRGDRGTGSVTGAHSDTEQKPDRFQIAL